jgi:hypothetical protein
MIQIRLLQQARAALGIVISEYDDHQQKTEARRLRSDFEAAIDAQHPKRNKILELLGRDPVGARNLVDELLREAA